LPNENEGKWHLLVGTGRGYFFGEGRGK